MIRQNLLLLFLCFSQFVFAQSTLSRVTFPINETQTKSILARAGIDLSHGHSSRNAFTTEIQDFELQRLDALGIEYTIDIADLSAHRKTAHPEGRNLLECQTDVYDERIPQNFELGSIGGFYSMSEVFDQLDVMAFLYPHLVSVRRPISNFKTWGNNSIFWVRLSDNPEIDENEPEILYTGLHHAREFVSVSQMIYYMWYLLENYDNDPMVRQIMDHSELYFVPVVNPDGLEFNVSGYEPETETFKHNHRKNLRDNDGDGSFDPKYDGVDLNRNYGFQWGYDDEGSSGFEGSDIYRGPAPFSEPEVQAIKYLCDTHQFKIALNFHSYGDLLVYPWGYEDLHTTDSITFSNYAALLTNINRFIYGRGLETVGYITNGDSDDWMYGLHGIYAMTPEVGDHEDGFYPPEDRIIPLCQSTLELNLRAARLVNSLISVTDQSPAFIQPGVNPLELDFIRYGLQDGIIQVSFNSLSEHITQIPSAFELNLDKFESDSRELSYVISSALPEGSLAKLEIVIQQGEYTFRDTITKKHSPFDIAVSDDGNLKKWNNSNGESWNTTTESFKSSPVSITDSPNGPYGFNQASVIMLNEEVDLTKALDGYVQFWAKWDIEDHFDYVVFQASRDGKVWENLCGERSHLGSIFQQYEEPLYDGKQNHWVLEHSDLSAYAGDIIMLRFVLVSEGFGNNDGFYFDDFKVVVIEEESVATDDIDPSAFSVFPNPVSEELKIEMPEILNPSVTVFDVIGKPVYTSAIPEEVYTIATDKWHQGIYTYVIFSSGEPVHTGLLSVIR